MVAGAFQRFLCLPQQGFRAPRTDRTVGIAGLTEAAAADAAAHDLQVDPVVHDLGGRDDGIRRENGGVQILNNPLGHLLRRAVERDNGGKRAVRVVAMLIEGGDVDAGDL